MAIVGGGAGFDGFQFSIFEVMAAGSSIRRDFRGRRSRPISSQRCEEALFGRVLIRRLRGMFQHGPADGEALIRVDELGAGGAAGGRRTSPVTKANRCCRRRSFHGPTPGPKIGRSLAGHAGPVVSSCYDVTFLVRIHPAATGERRRGDRRVPADLALVHEHAASEAVIRLRALPRCQRSRASRLHVPKGTHSRDSNRHKPPVDDRRRSQRGQIIFARLVRAGLLHPPFLRAEEGHGRGGERRRIGGNGRVMVLENGMAPCLLEVLHVSRSLRGEDDAGKGSEFGSRSGEGKTRRGANEFVGRNGNTIGHEVNVEVLASEKTAGTVLAPSVGPLAPCSFSRSSAAPKEYEHEEIEGDLDGHAGQRGTPGNIAQRPPWGFAAVFRLHSWPRQHRAAGKPMRPKMIRWAPRWRKRSPVGCV